MSAKREEIQKYLLQISEEGINPATDLWPKISARVPSSHRVKAQSRITKRLIFSVFVLLSVAAVVYYGIFVDRGLETVNQAGLIVTLNRTAQPYIYLGNAIKPAFQIQTDQDISVKLNWAYADINRFAFQLNISGLKLPEGVNVQDVFCPPVMHQNSGKTLLPYSPDNYPIRILTDQPGKPIEITLSYIFSSPIDNETLKTLNFDASFHLGACKPNQWNDFVGPTPVAIPNIGEFQIQFELPINLGKHLATNLASESNGISVEVKEITLAPSFIIVRVCYKSDQINKSNIKNAIMDASFYQDENSIPINKASPVEIEPLGSSLYCQQLWFADGYHQNASNFNLVIDQITFIHNDTFEPVTGKWSFNIPVK